MQPRHTYLGGIQSLQNHEEERVVREYVMSWHGVKEGSELCDFS
jgi:hypothetical protein